MDRLNHMFKLQEQLNQMIREKWGLDFPKDVWVEKNALALMHEVMELLDETGYKWWKRKTEVSKERVLDELADVLHFFLSLCLALGVEPDEIYQAYVEKNAENFRRQLGLSQKQGYVGE
ncbi:MAG: dUTPase [Bacillota bacterium]